MSEYAPTSDSEAGFNGHFESEPENPSCRNGTWGFFALVRRAHHLAWQLIVSW